MDSEVKYIYFDLYDEERKSKSLKSYLRKVVVIDGIEFVRYNNTYCQLYHSDLMPNYIKYNF
jgi:hypothetical protein